jgi:hypothetical protein
VEDFPEVLERTVPPAKPLPVAPLVAALVAGSMLVAGVRLVSEPVGAPASRTKAASSGQDAVKTSPVDRRRRSRLR